MIRDEAVEAALAAWGGCPVGTSPKDQVNRILEAAAPYMLAGAWDEGHDAESDYAPPRNPYREATRGDD